MHDFQGDLLEMEATLDFQEGWCMHRGGLATLPERVESSGCPGVPLCEEGLPRAEAILSIQLVLFTRLLLSVCVLFCEL